MKLVDVNNTVGADDLNSGTIIPITRCHSLPMRFRAIELNTRKARAIDERLFSNPRNAGGYCDTCKTRASVECGHTNARHTLGYCNVCKARTSERRIANARHTGGDRDTCEARTTVERRIANACYRFAVIHRRNYNVGIRTSADPTNVIGITVQRKIQSNATCRNRFSVYEFTATGTGLLSQSIFRLRCRSYNDPFSVCMTKREHDWCITYCAILRGRTGCRLTRSVRKLVRQ